MVVREMGKASWALDRPAKIEPLLQESGRQSADAEQLEISFDADRLKTEINCCEFLTASAQFLTASRFHRHVSRFNRIRDSHAARSVTA